MPGCILVGQSIVDYFAQEDINLINRYGLKKGANKLEFDILENLISESNILNHDAGGCVTNTAIGLDILGTPTQLYVKLGKDVRGDYFRKRILLKKNIHLMEEGSPLPTGIVVTFDNETQADLSRTNAYNHGCANDITLTHLLRRAIRATPLVYISLFSFLDDDSKGIMDIAKFAYENSRTIFDLGGVKNIGSGRLIEILNYAHGVFANQSEGKVIENTFSEDLVSISEQFWIVSKNGPNPTILYDSGIRKAGVPTIQTTRIVNSIGAGDAFAAGFISSFLRKNNLEESISAGNRYARQILIRTSFN